MFNQTPFPVHPLTGPVIFNSSDDAAWTIRTKKFYSRPISIIFSAICTEFQAAPFNRLSETTHIWKPLSTSTSLRIRHDKCIIFSDGFSGGRINLISCVILKHDSWRVFQHFPDVSDRNVFVVYFKIDRFRVSRTSQGYAHRLLKP